MRGSFSRRARFLTWLACGLLCAASAWAGPERPSGKWEKLDGSRLIPALGNDGDSFHVSYRGREYLFRLCYVDTPEGEHLHWLADRLQDQQKYWGITRKELFRQAEAARQFSLEKLSFPFTVWTDWQDAKGNSSIPRYFAVVETRSGDLAELLVAAGLARVYGYMPQHPHGFRGPTVMSRLRGLEAIAFRKRLGAWKNTTRNAPPRRG